MCSGSKQSWYASKVARLLCIGEGRCKSSEGDYQRDEECYFLCEKVLCDATLEPQLHAARVIFPFQRMSLVRTRVLLPDFYVVMENNLALECGYYFTNFIFLHLTGSYRNYLI